MNDAAVEGTRDGIVDLGAKVAGRDVGQVVGAAGRAVDGIADGVAPDVVAAGQPQGAKGQVANES